MSSTASVLAPSSEAAHGLVDAERLRIARELHDVMSLRRLVVSAATAKTHVSLALKLHAHDRAQLVVLAYQTGLVTAGGAGAISAADRINGHPAPGPAALAGQR